jgi:dTDP-4-dehydrorhamnose reductase
MKILLTGATGQLGREICRARLPSGTRLIAASRTQFDLSRPTQISRFVTDIAPDLVINAAAYTAVERAEQEPDQAFALNRDGAAVLAKAAAECNVPIVHLSTDQVFDGGKQGEWTEDDRPNPLNVYGQSKLIGEFAVAAANRRHLIVRTSWLYAAQGHNFLRTMLRLGAERSRLAVIADEIGRPTAAPDLAEMLLIMAARAMKDDRGWGLYHVSNGGAPTSWHGFASAIFSKAALWSGIPPFLEAVSGETSVASRIRPHNCVLDLGKLERTFGLTPRPWQTALADVLEELRLEKVQMWMR